MGYSIQANVWIHIRDPIDPDPSSWLPLHEARPRISRDVSLIKAPRFKESIPLQDKSMSNIVVEMI